MTNVKYNLTSYSESWAFTVTKMSKPRLATSKDYDRYFDHMRHFVTITKMVSEVHNGILHFHGMYLCHPRLYRKNLILYDFNVKFKKIYNVKGWEKYCNKNIIHQDNIKKLKCLFKRDIKYKFIV